MCVVVYRVTRLITTDEFPPVKIPRDAVVGYLFPSFLEDEDARVTRRPHLGRLGESIAYLILCEWCMSVWVSAGITLAIWYWTTWLTHWMMAVFYGITAAAFTGVFSQWFAKITEDK